MTVTNNAAAPYPGFTMLDMHAPRLDEFMRVPSYSAAQGCQSSQYLNSGANYPNPKPTATPFIRLTETDAVRSRDFFPLGKIGPEWPIARCPHQ